MRIVNISEESYNAIKDLPRPDPQLSEKYHAAADKIKASLNAPIDLCYCQKVTYDHKSDRYSATFTGNEQTATLKVSGPVAEFLTMHMRKSGSWLGRMGEGMLLDVYLIQV